MNALCPVPLFNPDTSTVAAVMPSPNHGVRAGERIPDDPASLYRHARAARRWNVCSAEAKCRRIIMCSKTAVASCNASRKSQARLASPAKAIGPTRPTSIPARLASRSPIRSRSRLSRIPAAPDRCRHRLVPQHRGSGWRIPAQRVLAHSDVAGRKDPGEKFPWRILQFGVGYWVEPVQIVPGPDFVKGDRGGGDRKLPTLAEYGYRVATERVRRNKRATR